MLESTHVIKSRPKAVFPECGGKTRKEVCFPLEAVFELGGALPEKMGDSVESGYRAESTNVLVRSREGLAMRPIR